MLEVEDEGLSEKIMKKLIVEKRQKQVLNDELEQLAKTLRQIMLRMMQDIVQCTLTEALDYLTKFNH